MKKILGMVLVGVLSVFSLAACDEGTTETKDVDNTQAESPENGNSNDQSEDENGDAEATDYDETLVDSDTVKVTLEDIEKVTDSDWDPDHYNVNLKIENKTDSTIEVQANEFSADGNMIDNMITFSETVSGEKTANGSIEIADYENDELPEIEEDMEFILTILDEETFETVEEHDVTIDLK